MNSSRKNILLIALFLGFSYIVSADDYAVCNIAYEKGRSGNYTESVENATACLDIQNLPWQTRKTALLVRAWGNYKLDNYPEAVADQKAGMQFGELSMDEYRNLTLYLKRAKKYPESLEAALEANRLDRESGGPTMPTQYHLGWAYYDNGQFGKAIIALSKGIPLQPDFPFVYFWRALAYEKIGDLDSAAEDLRTVKRLLDNEYWMSKSSGLLPQVNAAFERFHIARLSVKPNKSLQPTADASAE